MTFRKQLLEAFEAAIKQSPTLQGKVFRSRAAALSGAECPAIVIRPADETVNPLGEAAERDFYVQVLVIARGDIPDDVVDAAIEEVHSLLWADPTFGGIVARLFEQSSSWQFGEADGTACELDVRYRVRAYTPEHDLGAVL